MKITIEDIKRGLALTDYAVDDGQARMAPNPRGVRAKPDPENPPREAGVLLLLFPEGDDLQIILTRRTDTLRGHTGQISFPGGRRDPEDPSFVETALRETYEELGVRDDSIEILGRLGQTYIPPSNYQVHPVVAYLPYRPQITPNPAEVAEVILLPLSLLLHPETKREEYREIMGYNVYVPYYLVAGHKVWGATAIMLNEFEDRLRSALPSESGTAVESA